MSSDSAKKSLSPKKPWWPVRMPEHMTGPMSREHYEACWADLAPWREKNDAKNGRGVVLDREHVRGALALNCRWDGLHLAFTLVNDFGWPANFYLANALQKWSCALNVRLREEAEHNGGA